jgi:hypothetical protein
MMPDLLSGLNELANTILGQAGAIVKMRTQAAVQKAQADLGLKNARFLANLTMIDPNTHEYRVKPEEYESYFSDYKAELDGMADTVDFAPARDAVRAIAGQGLPELYLRGAQAMNVQQLSILNGELLKTDEKLKATPGLDARTLYEKRTANNNAAWANPEISAKRQIIIDDDYRLDTANERYDIKTMPYGDVVAGFGSMLEKKEITTEDYDSLVKGANVMDLQINSGVKDTVKRWVATESSGFDPVDRQKGLEGYSSDSIIRVFTDIKKRINEQPWDKSRKELAISSLSKEQADFAHNVISKLISQAKTVGTDTKIFDVEDGGSLMGIARLIRNDEWGLYSDKPGSVVSDQQRHDLSEVNSMINSLTSKDPGGTEKDKADEDTLARGLLAQRNDSTQKISAESMAETWFSLMATKDNPDGISPKLVLKYVGLIQSGEHPLISERMKGMQAMAEASVNAMFPGDGKGAKIQRALMMAEYSGKFVDEFRNTVYKAKPEDYEKLFEGIVPKMQSWLTSVELKQAGAMAGKGDKTGLFGLGGENVGPALVADLARDMQDPEWEDSPSLEIKDRKVVFKVKEQEDQFKRRYETMIPIIKEMTGSGDLTYIMRSVGGIPHPMPYFTDGKKYYVPTPNKGEWQEMDVSGGEWKTLKISKTPASKKPGIDTSIGAGG